MHNTILLLVLTLLSVFAQSQSIFSALHLNEERDYKTRRPRTIVETNIFYNTSGKKVEKNVKVFDEAGMFVKEERFDESGNLTASLMHTNDTLNRIKLTTVFERWTRFGELKETSLYTYDSNHHLIGIRDKGENGNVLYQSNLILNERGHPIQLALFDGNGNSSGKETATYLYDKNKAVTSVVADDGRKLSTDTIKISFLNASMFPEGDEIYNANGDLIKGTTRNLNGSHTMYEEEYSYDSFGNCTENRIYKVTGKNNGKRKRQIDRVFKKVYTY